MSELEYHRPRNMEDALRLAALEGASFIAGGTDLMVQMRAGKRAPAALISLRGVPGLDGIDVGPPVRIGALTRVADIVESAHLARHFGALHDGARPFGSVQIRNAATLGGNLVNASPAADLAPPLLVHDAVVQLRSATEERRVPLAEWFVGPGQTVLRPAEIALDVTLRDPCGGGSAFLRKTRVSMDIAIVSVAAYVRLEAGRCVEARVAVGAVAPTPMRLPAVEAALLNRPLDEATFAEVRRLAAEEVRPIDDLRASADYRRHLVSVFAVRALRAACERSEA